MTKSSKILALGITLSIYQNQLINVQVLKNLTETVTKILVKK